LAERREVVSDQAAFADRYSWRRSVGRSSGGRTTKSHALADAKGRLIAILLTGGDAHDCPLAKRLIRRAKPSKRMLGYKAYDSAELREEMLRQVAEIKEQIFVAAGWSSLPHHSKPSTAVISISPKRRTGRFGPARRHTAR
jgi:Transposase DDE domain